MAKFYASRIKAGKLELSEVPERWRTETEALLEE